MAKKVILPTEVAERISEFLDFLPLYDGYVWDFDFDFNLDDEQRPVIITLNLRKINN